MASCFTEMLLEKFKDKRVEVYLGDYARTREYLDYSMSQKSVVRGVLVDVVSDCLVIEVQKSNSQTNLVYLNAWCVSVVLEPQNGISMIDVFVDESEKQVK